jgi:soluble lytic murein transglycosylase-like protein
MRSDDDIRPERALSAASRGTPGGGSMRAFMGAAFAAARMAWMPSALTPAPVITGTAPSYDAMASRLVAMYPASRGHAASIVRSVHEASDRHRLDPCLVMGVIAKESSFDPGARNRRDLGLMQVNQDFHPDLVARAGGPARMLEPERNVRAGTELLARYRGDGDDRHALRRYHGLSKRNDYVQRVQTLARDLRSGGACIGETPQLAVR